MKTKELFFIFVLIVLLTLMFNLLDTKLIFNIIKDLIIERNSEIIRGVLILEITKDDCVPLNSIFKINVYSQEPVIKEVSLDEWLILSKKLNENKFLTKYYLLKIENMKLNESDLCLTSKFKKANLFLDLSKLKIKRPENGTIEILLTYRNLTIYKFVGTL